MHLKSHKKIKIKLLKLNKNLTRIINNMFLLIMMNLQ